MGWKSAGCDGCHSDSSRPPPPQPARLSLTRRRSSRARGYVCAVRVQNYTYYFVVRTTKSTAADRGDDVSRPGHSRDVASCGVTVSPDGRSRSCLAVAVSDLAAMLAPHVRHFVLPRTVAAAAVGIILFV
ncbi:unnamed protein product [Macrosiphum euphorbiae]|uniref:Uncharacterized protein n=1 Tax=Macrosiphum euphorbiae TaxID=13131 RepID=A0AAV0WWQ5_9HEMI|nr:unnamed protein product [Macrosiphum euphorbiae]